MLFKLPVASICKHNKRRDNDELQDNKKSKNNSIQASYDPDDKDMRWYKTIDKITRWSPADPKHRDWEWLNDSYICGGLTGGKAPEPGQKQELWIKHALCGSHHHSESQLHSQDKEGELIQHASFRTRCLQCISAARSQDHCMYHGSSSATCLDGNSYTRQKWGFMGVCRNRGSLHDRDDTRSSPYPSMVALGCFRWKRWEEWRIGLLLESTWLRARYRVPWQGRIKKWNVGLNSSCRARPKCARKQKGGRLLA